MRTDKDEKEITKGHQFVSTKVLITIQEILYRRANHFNAHHEGSAHMR